MRESRVPDLLALGNVIRQQRKSLNLTQEGLAERLGWTQERVSVLENGRYGMPSLPLLAHLAEAIDVPLGTLVEAVGFTMGGISTGTEQQDGGDQGGGGVSAALGYTLQRLLSIQALTLKDAMDEASDLMVEGMGADKIDVFLYEPETESLVALGTSNTEMGRKQHRVGLNRVPIANGDRQVQVFQTGKEYYTGQADGDLELGRGLIHAMGVRSLYAVPLCVDGSIRGLVVAESAQPGRFTPEERDFFKAASHWIGMVAHRAELHESVIRRTANEARQVVAEELLTMVAHDLGNQITPIKGRLDLLFRRLRRELDESAAQEIAEASGSLSRLSQMVTDLLDASRLEGGIFSLALQPTDLVDLVQQTVNAARQSRSEIEARTPAELIVEADPARLRQALQNLIGNAIQHTPAGTPVIVSVSRQQSTYREWAKIDIHDEGPGIAGDLLSQLFTRYGARGETGGLGLGLYLARGIATAHGGDLVVQSEIGMGTTFTMTLPI